MRELLEMGIGQLGRAMADGQLSSRELTQAYLAQIEQEEPKHNAFLTLTAEKALQAADAVDTLRVKKEDLPPLAGIPIAVKDNICTRGIRTTCGSRMLADFVPAYNATVMEKLQAQRAVMLGKLNMDEFAMGSSGENSAFAPVKNPADPTRVPGGSSGGSAAAVAACCAVAALGSDTGGSIRQPAAFCGVVGIKPTYGRVSRYGLVAFGSSLDQIGPLAHSVEDCALVLAAICGHDPRDSTSAPKPVPDFCAGLEDGVAGMRIALPRQLLDKGVATAVKQAVENAARLYEKMGAKVELVSMPVLENALPAYYVISSAEASSNMARFDGVRYGMRVKQFDSMDELYLNTRSQGFGVEVKRRIMLGTFALSAGYYDAYYKKALQVRTLVVREFERVFEGHDLILSPTAPTTAWRFGEKSDPLEMYMGDICTVPANIAGLPALSMPGGRDEDGLPVGVQLMGRAFDEAGLLRAARALERGRKEVTA